MDAVLREDFARFGRDPGAVELTGAILVARFIEAGLDARALEDAVQALAVRCRAPTPWSAMRGAGFSGNAEDYGALDNSHIGRVLASGRGIPITLGVLLIEVARSAGRSAFGIGFPAHFLVQVDDELVDPFRLEPVTRAQCRGWLPPAARAQSDEQLFAPASAHLVTLRMLNNVKGVLAGRGDWVQALEAVDLQCALAPAQPHFEVERGELWLRLGSVGSARRAFERALALATDPGSAEPHAADATVVAAIRARLAGLRGANDVLH